MTFSIPKSMKDLNSLGFDLLLPVELNDTNIERMLTQVMERAVKQGRTAPSRTDAKNYVRYRDLLRGSENISGFEDDRGEELIDGWLRTSVVVMNRIGLRRYGEQMDYVRPLTVASYRSGLPKSRSRHRKADAMVYRALVDEVRRGGAAVPEKEIAELFRSALGKGVDVGTHPWAEPKYNDSTNLDVNQMLTLRFLEGFEGNKNPAADKKDRGRKEAVPGAVAPIGRDLVSLLKRYGEVWSEAEVTGAIAALIGLRLFQLPLRIAVASRELLEGHEAIDVVADDAPNRLEIYCDFTRRRGGPSDRLAQECISRDMEKMRVFFSDRLLLRSVSLAAIEWGKFEGSPKMSPSQRLQKLADLVDDGEVNATMRRLLHSLDAELDESPAGVEGRALISQLKNSEMNPAEQLTMVLVEGLQKRGLENQIKWFWSTGGLVSDGLSQPFALLDGVQRSRTSWRYAPSEELVVVLLAMCFIEDSQRGTGRVRARMALADLLKRLEERFGILIDRPPAEFDNADARAGAAENLDAFTRQLQLLGCFRGLSDDFSAQYVTPPRRVS